MNIKEAIAAKRIAEDKIREVLDQLQKDTGLCAVSMSIAHYDHQPFEASVPERFISYVRINLEMI